MRILGISLLVAGLIALVLPYLTFTKKEKVFDLGPIEAVSEQKERVPVSPIVGSVILLVGGALIVVSMKRGAV